MNIGIVTTWFERGAAYVSKQIMDVLIKEHTVFIYSRGGEGNNRFDKKWNQSNVYHAKEVWLPTVTTPIDKKDFKKWITNNDIDIVIFNEQHWLEPVIWCNDWGVKTVAYVDYYKNSTIKSFELYDYLICNTKRHYSVFNWHKGVRFIPWGTDSNIFKCDKITANTIFHSIGMSPYRKGTDLLLRAYSKSNKLLQLVLHSQIDLLSYYSSDLELLEIINTLIDEKKLQIINETVGAPGLYSLGEFYFYPSRLDGIGLTVAESIAMGLIPVVSDNAPMNEFVLDNKFCRIDIEKFFCREDGYYWPIGEVNIAKMTSIIDELGKLSFEEKEQLRQEYKAFFNERLDWNKNSIGLLDLIKEIGEKDLEPIPLDQKNKWLAYSNSGINKMNRHILKFNTIFRLLKQFTK